MMSLHRITARGARQRDGQGFGHFGAKRIRPHGVGVHEGIDLVADPGEPLYAPMDGVIIREATYASFRGIVIQGSGLWDGYEVKILYANGLQCGEVRAGQLVGFADDITLHYGSGMTNHIHVEVRYRGELQSPHYLFGAFCL